MTHWVNHYLRARYRDGARGEIAPDGVPEFDCWGLARWVRFAQCGKRLLPSWGHVRNTMPRVFTRAYRAEAASMEECAPEAGAVAVVYRGALVVHVAVVIEVDGRLAALEINQGTGVRWRRIADFEAPYLRVAYYRDRPNLPEQT